MAKYIEFKFEDGWYRIPAEVIARNRAEYYVEADTEGMEDSDHLMYLREDIFVNEYNNTLKDPNELIDWLRNNMEWKDFYKWVYKDRNIIHPTREEQWNKISSDGNLKIVEV